MGATYTRQSTYTDGDVIQAADTNDEFDQLLAAFAAGTGHTHDGTAGEGGPLSNLLGHSITFGAGTSGTDITVTFDGETNNGVLKWMEDEDYFEFSDDLLIASTEKIQFRDTAIFINSSTDGQLDIDADTELEITAPTVDINASTAVLISNDLKLDSDSSVLGFGADNDTTLTHTDGTGLTLNSTNKLTFGDAASFVQQSSDGVLRIDGEATVDINASTAVTVSNDLKLDSDAAVLGFGADNDVTLTHVADTGLLLNSTMALQFNDASQFINAPSATVLDINATDEIELNATLVDINGNVDISGTLTVAGALDFGDLDISNVGSIALDTITNDGTDITLDSSGDIILDADGGDVFVKDAGTTYGSLTNSSGNLVIKSGTTTALTFSGANATLAGDLTISGDDLTMATNTAGALLIADGTNFNPVLVGGLDEISTVADNDVFLAIDTSGGGIGGLKKVTRSTIISGTGVSGNISNIVEDTSPQLGDDLDTNSHNILIDDAHFIGDENGNEQIVFQTTSSAVNQIEVTNAAVGNGVQIASTGGDTNIDLKLLPKGSGQVVIDGNVGIESGLIDLKNAGAVSKIKFYCESSNAHAQTLQGAPHSEAASNTLTLPSTGGDVNLVSTASTATLTNKTLTSPVINTGTFGTSILPVSADGTTLGSASKEFSDLFLADSGTIQFGNDQDTILTHTDGTGLTLNSTNKLCFNDASQFIQGASATVLDIAATDEIELTATLIDVVGNLAVSGTTTISGNLVFGSATVTEAQLEILDGATVTTTELNIIDGGTSATSTTVADADRVVMNDNGTMVQVAVTDLAAYFDDEITAMPNLVTTGALNSGSITSGFGTIDTGSSTITTTGLISGGSLDIDNVLINGTTIGHTDDTDLITLADGALTVAGTLAATTGTFSGILKTDDATEATSTTDGSLQTDGGLSVVKDGVFGDDVKLLSDASVIHFGADSEVTLTHVADTGLALKHTATADDKPIVLTLQTGETDMAANDVIGKLAFQAPDEGTGTDAILVAAAVQAVAEGDFSSSNNATRLEFHTGASEAAAVKMTLNSTGAIKPVTYQETYASLSAASTVDCDLLTANHFAVTMNQNTTFTFSNPPASGTSFAFTLIVTQHSTAVTLTWPNTVDWAGGSAPDAAGNNEVQAYGFITRDGGTTYYGFLGGTAIG